MIGQLFRKWFGLPLDPCAACEILGTQLAASERERKELLTRLLDKDKPEPPSKESEQIRPIGAQHVPWRVRQQMLEEADREKSRLMKAKKEEMAPAIEALEQELGLKEEAQ